ncbi:MAG: NUDIX hydrolase N-terminal domain-containing protein [Anaerolineales bacterium]
MKNPWLAWIQQLQAIAQNGLRYSKDKYDIDRFQQLRSIAGLMLAELAQTSPEPILDLFSSYSGTATPKIDVRAVIIQEGDVLLVRQIGEEKWTLPGGWADVGISLSEAVIKEAREESGYIVEPSRILAVQDRPRHNLPPIPEHTWKVFVQASILEDGEPDGLETNGVGFFSLDKLPPLSTGRVTRRQLERMFALVADPTAPAEFD